MEEDQCLFKCQQDEGSCTREALEAISRLKYKLVLAYGLQRVILAVRTTAISSDFSMECVRGVGNVVDQFKVMVEKEVAYLSAMRTKIRECVYKTREDERLCEGAFRELGKIRDIAEYEEAGGITPISEVTDMTSVAPNSMDDDLMFLSMARSLLRVSAGTREDRWMDTNVRDCESAYEKGSFNTRTTRSPEGVSVGPRSGGRSASLPSLQVDTKRITKSKCNRQKFPKHVCEYLVKWLIDNRDCPYPDQNDTQKLIHATGMTHMQLRNWLCNARRRVLIKLQEEKLTGPRHCSSHDPLRDYASNRHLSGNSVTNSPQRTSEPQTIHSLQQDPESTPQETVIVTAAADDGMERAVKTGATSETPVDPELVARPENV
eukprot:CAMPEP_0119140708 /NCGR_PEP_ID=MMETSP1310-20130426/29706_1 /TAXON_ID=464262 /ORGANISM="Genus nov. species nov., Strain RCC2339" /LENGTH=375 /DNA_ID=CAMNT_0007132085 /DNA_START=183 /DNA_END=1311 /DNA_ORIENTATION=-